VRSASREFNGKRSGTDDDVIYIDYSIRKCGCPSTHELQIAVLHSIPHAERVIAELVRVTRPGGYLHLIPEDYDMLHFQRGALDPRDFWHEAPASFGAATGTDLFIGRNVIGILARMKLEEITADYVVVDTLRSRDAFASLLEAWRDGYVDSISELTRFSRESALEYFDQMITTVRDPLAYAVWMVPVVSARIPSTR